MTQYVPSQKFYDIIKASRADNSQVEWCEKTETLTINGELILVQERKTEIILPPQENDNGAVVSEIVGDNKIEIYDDGTIVLESKDYDNAYEVSDAIPVLDFDEWQEINKIVQKHFAYKHLIESTSNTDPINLD